MTEAEITRTIKANDYSTHQFQHFTHNVVVGILNAGRAWVNEAIHVETWQTQDLTAKFVDIAFNKEVCLF